MTPVRGIRAGGALALMLLVPQLAPAAWDNVFQVTCFGCKRPQTAAYAPPCAAPCPAPCPTTRRAQVRLSVPQATAVGAKDPGWKRL